MVPLIGFIVYVIQLYIWVIIASAILSWLIAFNDGHFNNIELEDVAKQFDILLQHTQHTNLVLDSPREQWSELIARSLTCTARKAQP